MRQSIDPETKQFVRTQTVLDRYWSKVDRRGPGECWPWIGGTFANGYGRLSLDDARRSSVRSHRWGYKTLVGPIPPGEVVRHTCDVPLCHNPAHWVLGLPGDNSRDMVERGRSLRGSANPNGSLTEEVVAQIKRRIAVIGEDGYRGGRPRPGQVTYASIGREFGVGRHLIGQIARGQAWTHVDPK